MSLGEESGLGNVILINILDERTCKNVTPTMNDKSLRQKLINNTFQTPSAPAETDRTCPLAQRET